MRFFAVACLLVVLFIASPSFAQIPIAERGNLLVTASYNTDLGSSDQGVAVQLEANGAILVDEGHDVRYFFNQSGNNLAGVSDWMTMRYDDSAWEVGVSAVGYNCIEITTVPDDNDQGAIFSRYDRFDISGAASVTSMTIRADYDDSFIAWLNGIEIVRANIGSDDAVPEWNYFAVSHESTNLLGPDPARWNAPVSNLFGAGDDNPSGSIVEFTFDVLLDPAAVQPAGKLPILWGSIKNVR